MLKKSKKFLFFYSYIVFLVLHFIFYYFIRNYFAIVLFARNYLRRLDVFVGFCVQVCLCVCVCDCVSVSVCVCVTACITSQKVMNGF